MYTGITKYTCMYIQTILKPPAKAMRAGMYSFNAVGLAGFEAGVPAWRSDQCALHMGVCMHTDQELWRTQHAHTRIKGNLVELICMALHGRELQQFVDEERRRSSTCKLC